MQADTHFKRLMESIYLYQTNIQVFLQAEKKLTFFLSQPPFYFKFLAVWCVTIWRMSLKIYETDVSITNFMTHCKKHQWIPQTPLEAL